jgi:hypothetical protein
MRTTVTLDPDVEVMLRAVIREREVTFKDALNDALRAGLRGAVGARKVFCQKTVSLGAEQNFRWEKALETAAALEDEELMRKMALRK